MSKSSTRTGADPVVLAPNVLASNDPAPNDPARASGRWLLGVFLLLALIVGLEFVIAYRMDVFGILRDTKGRSLITSHHERKAKYLLNEAYVPENFDALIVGASASVNWRPSLLTGYRFYDESLEGGNATEERFIVEHALERGHFKVAIVGLYPRITMFHTFEDGLDKANRAEALGSLSAFDIEYETASIRLLHHTPSFYPDGSHEMPVHTPQAPRPGDPKMIMRQDARSVTDYHDLVAELQQRGIRVVYVVYPVFEPYLQYNQAEFDAYLERARAALPSAPILDLNAPEYAAFRSDPANYVDEIHLSRNGADALTRIINLRMHQALEEAPAPPR